MHTLTSLEVMNHEDGPPDLSDETVPIDPAVPIGDDAPLEDVATEEPRRERVAPPITARTEVPFGLILFLVIAILLVIFTAQNSSEDVPIKFLIWEASYPLALIIIAVVAVTVVLDEILGLFLRGRRRKRLAEKRELKQLREMNR